MLMKWEPGGMKSELARARGLGSARDGVKHWLHQRVSAVANLILVPWLLISLVGMVHKASECQSTVAAACDAVAYQAAVLWLTSGFTPIVVLLFTLSVFYHVKMGLQIVIEDYVHHEGAKVVTMMAVKLILAGLAVACLFATLKITL